MAGLSGGHWATIDEVKKLTQSTLMPGIIDEDIRVGNPLIMLPMAQANHTGSSIKWLRTKTSAIDDVINIGRSADRRWTESVEYTVMESELKGCNISRVLDKFVPSIYGNFNNYELIELQDMMSAIKKKAGAKIIYDDSDSNTNQMDGIHNLARDSYGQAWDVDAAETALSLEKWRGLQEAMKYGVDYWLAPTFVARRIGAMMQEKGLAGLAYNVAGSLGSFSQGLNTLGESIYMFGGKPIISSDYLVAETANSGTTSARTVNTTGTGKMYSLFGIKKGNASIGQLDPGLKIGFGKTSNDGDFVNLEYFNQLESKVDTKGMGITAYLSLLNGSAMCIGRMFDFTDAAITV